MMINAIAYCRKSKNYGEAIKIMHIGTWALWKLILMDIKSGKMYIIVIKLDFSLPSQKKFLKII